MLSTPFLRMRLTHIPELEMRPASGAEPTGRRELMPISDQSILPKIGGGPPHLHRLRHYEICS
jgi:hypothetical protein